jgi:hypothetical protein
LSALSRPVPRLLTRRIGIMPELDPELETRFIIPELDPELETRFIIAALVPELGTRLIDSPTVTTDDELLLDDEIDAALWIRCMSDVDPIPRFMVLVVPLLLESRSALLTRRKKIVHAAPLSLLIGCSPDSPPLTAAG